MVNRRNKREHAQTVYECNSFIYPDSEAKHIYQFFHRKGIAERERS